MLIGIVVLLLFGCGILSLFSSGGETPKSEVAGQVESPPETANIETKDTEPVPTPEIEEEPEEEVPPEPEPKPEPDFNTKAGNTAKAAELSTLFKEAGQEDGTLTDVYISDNGSLIGVTIMVTRGLDEYTLKDLIRMTVEMTTYQYPDTAVYLEAFEGQIKVGTGDYSTWSRAIEVEVLK